MTSQCVTELEGHLRDMLGLKPPGVTGGKISKITELCNANIQVGPQFEHRLASLKQIDDANHLCLFSPNPF